MGPYFRVYSGNPSNIHTPGRMAREAVDQARSSVAYLLGCSPQEIYFTSGGTESDNLAVLGTAWEREKEGRHIITSSVEHHAVLRSCQWLETRGWQVTYLPVDGTGMVTPRQYALPSAAIRSSPRLCTRTMRSERYSPLRISAPMSARSRYLVPHRRGRSPGHIRTA